MGTSGNAMNAVDLDLRRFLVGGELATTEENKSWHEGRVGRLMDELNQEIATTPRSIAFRRALLLVRDIFLEHFEEGK